MVHDRSQVGRSPDLCGRLPTCQGRRAPRLPTLTVALLLAEAAGFFLTFRFLLSSSGDIMGIESSPGGSANSAAAAGGVGALTGSAQYSVCFVGAEALAGRIPCSGKELGRGGWSSWGSGG